MNLQAILKTAIENEASDVIIKNGSKPALKVRNKVLYLADDSISADEIQNTVDEIFKGKSPGEATFPCVMVDTLGGEERFRIVIARDRESFSLVLRPLKDYIPIFTQLHLSQKLMSKIATLEGGLFLFGGTSGSGRTTTTSSLLDYINANEQKHIVTFENPIEYAIHSKKCIVEQNRVDFTTDELHHAAANFGMRCVDIAFIGNVNSKRVLDIALNMSESGVMVFAVIRGQDIRNCLLRIVNLFHPDELKYGLPRFAFNLAGVYCQQLIERTDRPIIVPNCEVFFNSPAITSVIKDGRIEDIYNTMHEEKKRSIFSFDDYLIKLVHKGRLTKERAVELSSNPEYLLTGIKLRQRAVAYSENMDLEKEEDEFLG